MAEHAETLAALPLLHQPGEVWEYSFSTDVLGRVIEVVEGGEAWRHPARAHLRAARHGRHRVLHSYCEAIARGKANLARRLPENPRRRSGARHRAAAMRVGRRRLVVDARRLCALPRDAQRRRRRSTASASSAPRTIRYMASDHLGPDVDRRNALLAPGHGFGLGFCVRLQSGLAPTIGNIGDYFWGGAAGTSFRISPQELAVRDFDGAGARASRTVWPDIRQSLQRRDRLIHRLAVDHRRLLCRRLTLHAALLP